MNKYKHIPVMLDEVITGLAIKPDGIYVDCTMGGAGHASEILKRLSDSGRLYCFEHDDYAIEVGSKKLSEVSNNYKIIQDNFINLKTRLNEVGVEEVDGIFYDLGVSSFQFDIAERGFSYNQEAELDMRMDRSKSLNAYEIVNRYDYEELKKIFYLYGEERFSPAIARRIIRSRQVKPITTTFELSEIIKQALPPAVRRKAGHPAKKVFQALRIAVNNELEVFEKSLVDALGLLKKGGRIAVISFHSLEDRICKQVFKSKTEIITPRGLPIKANQLITEYRLINRKVITPSEEELNFNRRAHSAKLRIIERIKEEK